MIMNLRYYECNGMYLTTTLETKFNNYCSQLFVATAMKHFRVSYNLMTQK